MKIKLTIGALLLSGAAAFAQTDTIPDGVKAIQQYSGGVYLTSLPSDDGDHLFWSFAVQGYDKDHYVVVDVPPNTTIPEFGACYTVAADAVRFYKAQMKDASLPHGRNVQYPPANLTDIVNRYGANFLGAVPSLDHTAVRWLFYVPPNTQYSSPGVVVNVYPGETGDQFLTAYWTALGAVRSYIAYGDLIPKKQNPPTPAMATPAVRTSA